MDPQRRRQDSGCRPRLYDLHGKRSQRAKRVVTVVRLEVESNRGRGRELVDHLEPEPKARLGWRVVNSHSAVILDDQDSEVVEE